MRQINFKKLKILTLNKKVFLLIGKNSYKKSGAEILIKKFIKAKNVVSYEKKKDIPEYEELLRINKMFDKFKPDILLAIGGGAIMDYSKIINILKSNKNLKSKIKNYNYDYTKKKSKLITVPTTGGSGAEVTSNAVIYLNKKKFSFESKLLIPDHYILEPKLILNNSKQIKAASGFDAIAQAIESFFSTKSNKLSENFALNSLKISKDFFLKYLKEPNLYNSKKMLYAANLSGKAINISKTIAPHAVSYPFTSKYGISHGYAVSLNFEKILEYNYVKATKENKLEVLKKYQKIFKITKTQNIVTFVSWLRYLKREAGLNDNYRYHNINIKRDISNILDGVNLLRLKNNPIQLTKDELFKLLI